jgi:hypothetical protein
LQALHQRQQRSAVPPGDAWAVDAGQISWNRAGTQVASCGIWLAQTCAGLEMRLSYTNIRREPNGERIIQPIKDTIPIVTTPCYFGGVRFWFMCHCGARVGTLYAPAVSWQCRHCYRITYQSSNDTDPRVRRVLGGDWSNIRQPSGEPVGDAGGMARAMRASDADLFVLLKAYRLIEQRHARNMRQAEHYARSQAWKARHRAAAGREFNRV